MFRERRSYHKSVVLLLLVVAGLTLVAAFASRLLAGQESAPALIARGGGITIIQGGTGPSGFVPVLTKLGFYAERTGAGVRGGLECLALAPEAATGSTSAQFTVNAMYVTGRVTGATVHGDTATLTGIADVTGLGAGHDVAFTFVVHGGGPGATSVLTVSSLPTVPFHEVLLEGVFQIRGGD